MHNIITDENSGILYKKWEADSTRAVFVLVHGLGAHSHRWQFLAEFFQKEGISSYAIELKGFGETKNLKGHINSFNIYYDDVNILKDIAQRENAGTKVYLLGESMGALIAFNQVVKYPNEFDGLIVISPAFKSRLKFSILDYAKIVLLLAIHPKKQLKMPFTSSMCTRDKEYLKIMDPDEREHRLATPKLLAETLFAQIKALKVKDGVKIPVLFLLAGEDKLVSPEASEKLFAKLEVKDKTLIEYPGMYHALSIEEGRERVFSNILEWIEQRI